MSAGLHVCAALLFCLGLLPALFAQVARAEGGLTAAQIVEKNVAARGGRLAWHAVQSMRWSGRMDAGRGDSAARSSHYVQNSALPTGRKALAEAAAAAPGVGADQVQLPFTLTLARPYKSRLDLVFAGQTAVQVFDGSQGWKLRPFLNRMDVEAFSPDEQRIAASTAGLEGPLVNYVAEGKQVTLDGVEVLDGHDAYRLNVTGRDGTVRQVWIDAQSFLDVKVEGAPRRMDGSLHRVWTVQRDFRAVDGLNMPFVLETVVDGYRERHRVMIDSISLNPKLDAAAFSRPAV